MAVVLAQAAPVNPAPTATPGPMTLQQAVDYGLTHNTNVQRAASSFAQAGANLARDRAFTLPTVNGELQNQMNKQTGAGQFGQIGIAPTETFSQNTAGLTGTFNGLNLVNIYQARSDKQSYDVANEDFYLAREQSISDTETAFYKLVQDRQLTEVARENVNYNRVLEQIAEANFKAGKVAGLDQLKAQVSYTQALEQLAAAGADEEDAREDLAQLINAPMTQQFALPSEPPQPPLPSLDEKVLDQIALANRPEIATAQAQLNNAFISYYQVDAPNRPTVALNGAWGNQVSPTNNALFYNQCTAEGFPPSACGPPNPSHFYEISIVSQWTLPLLDWGTVHAGHESAKRAIDTETTVLQAAKQQAFIDIDQAARRLLVDRENLRLATGNITVARQAALISAVQYKVGLATQTDVSAAQQQYLTAARDLLAAQVAYVLGLVRLKLATGTLTEAI
ncbi:MAG: TolC family protein [Candidatus Eremiobacteraeota bacterium]|nr:TolC family protein [Candidatus Eremiobacteraeota bacterium]